MENRLYESNSKKTRAANEAERKVNKVVSGAVTTKKSGLRNIKRSIISDDAGNIKSYVIEDVLIPGIKRALADVVKNGIDMLLYGEVRNRSNSSDRFAGSYVSYNSYSSSNNNERYNSRSFNYDDIIFASRADAEHVLRQLEDLIAGYGNASIGDLYDLAGLPCDYTNSKYGWTNLRNADVVSVRDGWMIKLPRAVVI